MRKIGFLMLAVILTGGAPASAQEGLSEAMQQVEKAAQILGDLGQAHERGESARARALGTVYGQTMAKVDEIAQGLKMQGRHADAVAIEDRVHEATLRHRPVLERVRSEVPEQARQGIDRALEVSLQGHQASTQAVGGALKSGGPPQGIPGGLIGGGEDREGRGRGGPPAFVGGAKKGEGGRGGRPF